ncbi:uncharacterized protein P174DRAFT_512991 [Aspergillus novofumigatus IBT 16806]|uniref:Uncharacterized protein n=1 Tax=Aspergillus novofumigatus (strain IBT 16806) TaxID=1392255 RepID=A0A2I1C459_ASPN1|nr:uncharacterized protein P174DRAFT_512991 [Aspergillus novofumigatus IBT 16806]PKX92398.1 hypothetical protein P174DRAFT_512991 [Aspergillus novofumigatus IBT 16806]
MVVFHYLLQLPTELRRLIWKHCLPHRIAEEDTPDFLLDGNECRQACWADRIKNAQPPPRRDVLHLNWTRRRYVVWENADDPSSLIGMFLWRAEDLGMQPSVVAEIIHPFRLKALLDGVDASDSPNKDVANTAYCAKSQSALAVAMAAVSLHIRRKAALRSGLFGLLGDAPVQMVEGHALEKESAVHMLFKAFIIGTRENLNILGTNPGSAWLPQLLEQEDFIRTKRPWVIQARQGMPKLRPRVKLRYCTNECYRKERLPKNFGTS